MKKVISILFAMMLMVSAMALAGCGGGSGSEGEAPAADSQFIGTWTAVSAEFNGEETSMDEVLDGGQYVLELSEDGTAVVKEEAEATGTWTENSDGIHVKAGDTNADFKATDDGKLALDIIGAQVLFEKQ